MIDKTCFSWIQIIKKSDIPANAKYLCFYLSTFMNLEHNVAWPSQKRISAETGMSEPTVRKWLNWLNNEGWLITKKQAHAVRTSGGVQMQNEYIIDIPDRIIRGVNELLPSQKGEKNNNAGGVNESPKGGKQLTPNNNRSNNINNKKLKGKGKPDSKDNTEWLRLGRLTDFLPMENEPFEDYKARFAKALEHANK